METKQLQLEDFLKYKSLSSPLWAPGGERAAFVVTEMNADENSYESRLYLYDGTQTKQLTAIGKEGSFTWLDDHRLLFSAVRSAREEKMQKDEIPFTSLYCLDIHGGEALPFATFPFPVTSVIPMDEDHLCVLGLFDKNCPDYYAKDDEARSEFLKKQKEDRDYEVLDEVPFWFNGRGFVNGKRTGLFSMNLKSGEIERLSPQDTSVSLAFRLGDEVIWEGRPCQPKQSWHGLTIHATSMQGKTRVIFSDDDLMLSDLLEAGDDMILLATDGKKYGMNENAKVYCLTRDGQLTLLRDEVYNMYGSVGSDCRYGGGQQARWQHGVLYHLTTREGDCDLYTLHPDGTSTPLLEPAGSIDCIDVNAAGRVLMVAMLDMKLQELYEYDAGRGTLQQITHLNDEVLKDIYVASPEEITLTSCNEEIRGWILKPRNYDPEKTYPAVLDIHGGPKTVYGPVFYHEMQLWANMGYFVFYCNPKGSDGRDNEFMDIRGKYGTVDYQNLMDFTDEVLRRYPQIDPSRLCETGGSYGGFMTNWIIGHTDRFCCTASQRSIANWLGFYGTSDIGLEFVEDQNLANIYDHPEKLWEHSPLKYAGSVKTPTLFIHSDQDYRCPLPEGLQMYASLLDRGIPARLCLFHGENHELSRSGKPKHRVRRLKEITDGFEKYSRKKEA